MNCRSFTDPSCCTKKDTSDSRGVLCSGRCQRRSTWATMFCKYSGKGNSTPSVLTVATSDPVAGVSPGSGATLGVVRGAASRFALSATGGGAAFATVLFGDLALGAGAGCSAAGRSTAGGALRSSSLGAGAATRCTRYVGGAGGRAGAPSHFATVSGSATSPTSVTPAARITANTWTTSAYGTRPSARRYTPVGRLVRTKAGKVARKSSYDRGAWSM